jgi:class 3 adenylate cyclase
LEDGSHFECVALVLDLNHSEKLVGLDDNNDVGQFIRDVIVGWIDPIEESGGSVINFTGDGMVAVLPDEESAGMACFGIARDLRKTREHLESSREGHPEVFGVMEAGLGMKIAIERGILEVNSIKAAFLGKQYLLVGPPTIYATRLLSFGRGDRCLIGPNAAKKWPYGPLEGPFVQRGKRGREYEYYKFDLEDSWAEG